MMINPELYNDKLEIQNKKKVNTQIYGNMNYIYGGISHAWLIKNAIYAREL